VYQDVLRDVLADLDRFPWVRPSRAGASYAIVRGLAGWGLPHSVAAALYPAAQIALPLPLSVVFFAASAAITPVSL
jgi:hypothetical protein